MSDRPILLFLFGLNPIRACLLAFVGSIALATALEAAPEPRRVEVRFDRREPWSAPAKPVVLAWEVAQAPRGTEPVSRQISPEELERELSIELPAGKACRLLLQGEGIWSEPKVVQVDSTTDRIELAVWRTGWVRVALEPPRGEVLPEQGIRLRFEASTGSPRGEGRCVREPGREVRCEAPVGIHHLALRVPGFASLRFWDQKVSSEREAQLGRRALVAGASVVGTVSLPAKLEQPAVSVELVPETQPLLPPGEVQRMGTLARKTTADARGFFAFEGLEAGSYRLRASHPKLGQAELAPVALVPGSETWLRQPLVLAAPSRLEVELDPPLDPEGQRWRIQLAAIRPGNALEPPRSFEASEAGRAVLADLAPGPYLLQVASPAFGAIHGMELMLPAPDPVLSISLELIPVAGRLSYGSDPVPFATLRFGGQHGIVGIETRTDERGQFSTTLPRSGAWTVSVEAEEPSISVEWFGVAVERPRDGRPARLELRLPKIEVRGRVVSAEGQPVPGALVRLWGIRHRGTTATDP